MVRMPREMMEISIKQYGNEVSASIPEGSSLDRIMIALKGLVVAAGFHPVNADQHMLPDDWGISEAFSQTDEKPKTSEFDNYDE